MQTTANIKLNLVEDTDIFDKNPLNANFLSLDSLVSSLQATIVQINTKLQTLGVSGIPTGCIIIWSGSSSNIPTGWALCNGSNGTPDLRNRFVVGAGSNYSVGDTGGEKEHKLTVDEMPNHTHKVGVTSSNTGNTTVENIGVSQIKTNLLLSNRADTLATGGSSPHNNMPPYYALCYIMKL